MTLYLPLVHAKDGHDAQEHDALISKGLATFEFEILFSSLRIEIMTSVASERLVVFYLSKFNVGRETIT